jgi:hypothetical protein
MKFGEYDMHFFLFLTLICLVNPSWSACEEYFKIHGIVNLKAKVWETTHTNKKSQNICGELPLPSRPNIEVRIRKGKKSFTTQIFRPLIGLWHITKESEKFDGGTYEIKYLSLDTFVPSWFKGANLTLIEISSKRVIVETTL